MSIDDFWTGYSFLTLSGAPLKIDEQSTSALQLPRRGTHLGTVADLGRSLEFTVAEVCRTSASVPGSTSSPLGAPRQGSPVGRFSILENP